MGEAQRRWAAGRLWGGQGAGLWRPGAHQGPNAGNGNVLRPVDCEAKVAELHDAVAGDEDVLRLDVAVHDGAAMEVSDGCDERLYHLEGRKRRDVEPVFSSQLGGAVQARPPRAHTAMQVWSNERGRNDAGFQAPSEFRKCRGSRAFSLVTCSGTQRL